MDTRDSEQRGTFHASSLNSLLWGIAKLENYHTRALYPVGPECCSNRTVTFNIGDPDKMRTMTYMLYQLRVFERGIYGNRPAPTPIPEDEVNAIFISYCKRKKNCLSFDINLNHRKILGMEIGVTGRIQYD